LGQAHHLAERMNARLRQLAEQYPDGLPTELVEGLMASLSGLAEPLGQTERRRAARLGDQVWVVPPDPAAPTDVLLGQIQDLSLDGVRLWLPAPIPLGAHLRLQSPNAPPGSPWIEAVARHCQAHEQGWFVGCEFVRS